MTALIPYLSNVFFPVAPKSGATYNGPRKHYLIVRCFLMFYDGKSRSSLTLPFRDLRTFSMETVIFKLVTHRVILYKEAFEKRGKMTKFQASVL